MYVCYVEETGLWFLFGSASLSRRPRDAKRIYRDASTIEYTAQFMYAVTTIVIYTVLFYYEFY
jgi:hypothetical protein